ncbi:MAG: HD family phosphohydrolase, partial [Clostridium sp.]
MKNKREIIDIINLKAGMITSDDIVINGTVLVGKGVKLTEQMLDKLKSLYAFDKVEVFNNEKTSKEAIAIEEARNTLKNVS